MSGMTPEMEALKTRLKATWMSGDYAQFAKPMEPGLIEEARSRAEAEGLDARFEEADAAGLDSDRQAALREDLEQLWTRHNRATDGTTQYDGEYLEVVAVKA